MIVSFLWEGECRRGKSSSCFKREGKDRIQSQVGN